MGQEYQEYKTNLGYIVVEDPSQQGAKHALKETEETIYLWPEIQGDALERSSPACEHLTALMSQLIKVGGQ